ncbi:MAG TPA: phospho-sugar mutase, partial [Candidatus Paceibacterota bacterium]|nr:phospho-sugar mutase [Candidatus Paceibacterota bacterium]
MTNEQKIKLDTALGEKKLNQTAYDRIVKWLTQEEYEEYKNELSSKIEKREWELLMDQFYTTVIFATAGLRGKMDIGTNRINKCTIRMASQAYAQYLLKHKTDIAKKGVAIAYDSRINSKEFMEESARVLAANGIPVFIFKYYRATPELSFAVRKMNLAGGIVITASHNPPEFNGYKVYDECGVQVLPKAGLLIEAEFKQDLVIKKMPFEEAVEKGLVSYISDDIDKQFAESAKKVSVYPSRNVKIVFSPLHGVGSESVLPVLKALGFQDIEVVEEQMTIDGHFPSVANHFPNPEFPEVYEPAIKLAEKTNADIILLSDPDADRLGLAVPDKDRKWHVLSGNQAAALMGYFYLRELKAQNRLPACPVVIKTSVTTELISDIAEYFGAEVMGDLLVGFKFIGERQENMVSDKTFVFGCEESVGYLFSNDYRDKG